MKKILYYFLFLPIFLSAQINESDTLNLKANLSLTGFYQGGNVETLIFRAKSDLSFKPLKKWVFKTKNSYVYQEFGKEKADEDILSLNFLHKFHEQWSFIFFFSWKNLHVLSPIPKIFHLEIFIYFFFKGKS